MRWTLIIFLIWSLSISAQKRKYMILSSTMFVSGMLDGTVETISHHYSYFKKRFPNSNNQYWNPQISWRNKYKLGDPTLGPKFTGSTTVLAWTTDGYHMLRTSKRMTDFVTLAYYSGYEYSEIKKNKKQRYKTWAMDFLVISIARSIGFTVTYNLMFIK